MQIDMQNVKIYRFEDENGNKFDHIEYNPLENNCDIIEELKKILKEKNDEIKALEDCIEFQKREIESLEMMNIKGNFPNTIKNKDEIKKRLDTYKQILKNMSNMPLYDVSKNYNAYINNFRTSTLSAVQELEWVLE